MCTKFSTGKVLKFPKLQKCVHVHCMFSYS